MEEVGIGKRKESVGVGGGVKCCTNLILISLLVLYRMNQRLITNCTLPIASVRHILSLSVNCIYPDQYYLRINASTADITAAITPANFVPFLFNQLICLPKIADNVLIGFNAINGSNILTAAHFDDKTFLAANDFVRN